MDSKRRICVVTGSRAEYGLLFWVIHDLYHAEDVDLQLVVTGQHLSPEFGRTASVIELDGFPISDQVEMLLSSDTTRGVTKSVGLGVICFADTYARLAPDIVVLLGDRFEIFAAAQAAMIANIPIAHVAGGDTTEGSFDESIRHCITKMAHLHFVTNGLSARRLRQMGEDPANIYVVGNPGLDNIRRLRLLARVELEQELGIELRKKNFLITFHPVTLETGSSEAQLAELLAALDSFADTTGLFFTMPNSDPGGRKLAATLSQWVAGRPHARVFTSLGQVRYLSLMAHVDAVVGNSSSGLYEAPSFRIPTVNIGNRQQGRLAADSVLHCAPDRHAIAAALRTALELDCSRTVNPYGDGNSAARIVEALTQISNPRALLKKHFHMMSEV